LKRLLPLTLLIVGCDSAPKICTQIGCTNLLVLTLTDALEQPVEGWQGHITLGENSWNVDCIDTANADPAVICANGTIAISLTEEQTIGVLIVDLVNATGNTCTASGVEPMWTENQPNGPDCPPICKQAELSLAIDDV
jgi:hypothetical protein